MSASGQEAGEASRAEAKRVDAAPGAERGLGHSERFCPSCSTELKESGCKLSYPRCGFYLRGAKVYDGRSVHLTWRAISVYNGERF
jgi:hypothetical protein